jgi:hypothetical protein
MKRSFVFLIFTLATAACASSEGWKMPYSDDDSKAPGDAFAADSMMVRKDMPHRPDPKPWEFYYKHCSINGDETFYSMTSYDCTGPAF